jgi:hypothetical protein
LTTGVPVVKEGKMGECIMPSIMEKREAHQIVDRLPERATWDDLMHEIYVREVIKKG